MSQQTSLIGLRQSIVLVDNNGIVIFGGRFVIGKTGEITVMVDRQSDTNLRVTVDLIHHVIQKANPRVGGFGVLGQVYTRDIGRCKQRRHGTSTRRHDDVVSSTGLVRS